MKTQTIDAELREQLDRLPLEQQRRVLDFARSLAASEARGVPGKTLLSFAGTIAAADLAVMKRAIEEECERIDHDEW